MDAGLLRAIGEEIGRRLTEQEVQRVSDLGSGRFLLRFATPDRDNLLISVRPDLPRLYLMPRGGGHREIPHGPFAAALDRDLTGARLETIRIPPGERIADLGFRRADSEGARVTRRLVAELFGRAASAHLLDAAGIVLATTRRGEARGWSAATGEPYRPPAARPTLQEASTDAEAGTLPGSDPPVFEVHSVRPLEELTEEVPIGRDDLVLAGGPGREPPPAAATGRPRHVTRFTSPSEAAAAVFERLERRRDFEAERARHQARARKEV
ncbi:MAG TPA: NFACT family protein, partial [Candidatus Polarisedimenticolia bacterium]|nr:NFACT family protein [Candidatus Polarisedimenticolia bacterium]